MALPTLPCTAAGSLPTPLQRQDQLELGVPGARDSGTGGVGLGKGLCGGDPVESTSLRVRTGPPRSPALTPVSGPSSSRGRRSTALTGRAPPTPIIRRDPPLSISTPGTWGLQTSVTNSCLEGDQGAHQTPCEGAETAPQPPSKQGTKRKWGRRAPRKVFIIYNSFREKQDILNKWQAERECVRVHVCV